MVPENRGEQNIVITKRQRVHLDDIAEVESFTESEIVALSSFGQIVIEGEDLHIDAFSAQTGVLEIHGQINGVSYLEDKGEKTGGGLFSRFLH